MLQCTIPNTRVGSFLGHARCAAAFACLALALAARAEPSSSPDPAQALSGRALVTALRGGGYTLYFRHTATDFSQNDRAMTGYEECATQRNLSAAGREQAREIGKTIRDDLAFSGYFDVLDPALYPLAATSPEKQLEDKWASLGASTVLLSTLKVASGRVDLRARLISLITQSAVTPLGIILTGLVVGRGANFVHQFVSQYLPVK